MCTDVDKIKKDVKLGIGQLLRSGFSYVIRLRHRYMVLLAADYIKHIEKVNRANFREIMGLQFHL